MITIDKAQRVYLGNDPVNIHDLGKLVKAKAPDYAKRAVFIRCDEGVPFGSFAAVVDAMRQAGIQNISVVTQPISGRGGG